MYQEERLLKILEHLKIFNKLSVHEICQMFNISRDTARRDIVKLSDEGAVVRTHGGITLPGLNETIRDYRERLQAHSDEKKLIAAEALSLITENNHYFFDVSTTIRYLSENLDKKVTIYTHSLDNLQILSAHKEVSLFSIGGQLNRNNRFFYSPCCETFLDGITFDAAFYGAGAITEAGIYYIDYEDAFIKQFVSKRAKKIIVLADFDKYKKTSYYRGLSWDQIDILISDKTPPPMYMDIISSHGIELILTPSQHIEKIRGIEDEI